jgi:hypothetical protein
LLVGLERTLLCESCAASLGSRRSNPSGCGFPSVAGPGFASGSGLDLILTLSERLDPVGQVGLIGARLFRYGLEFVAKRGDAILIGILHLDLMPRERREQIVVEQEIAGCREIEHSDERQQAEQHDGKRARHGERSRKGSVGESQVQTVAAHRDFATTVVLHVGLDPIAGGASTTTR